MGVGQRVRVQRVKYADGNEYVFIFMSDLHIHD